MFKDLYKAKKCHCSRLASNLSRLSCLYLPSAGITDMSHHIHLIRRPFLPTTPLFFQTGSHVARLALNYVARDDPELLPPCL